MTDLNRCLRCNRKLHTFVKIEKWLLDIAERYKDNTRQGHLYPHWLFRGRRCKICSLDHKIYADGTREYSDILYIPNLVMVRGYPDPKYGEPYTLIDPNPINRNSWIIFNNSGAKRIDKYIDPNIILQKDYLQKLIILL